MKGPEQFVRHLTQHGYHPRSDTHSNILCQGILVDLLETSPLLAERATHGTIVAKINHTVQVAFQRWNTDLVLGPPAELVSDLEQGAMIHWQVPTVIQVGVEIKGVMTEHGKARRNRLRDLQAFHDYAHRYNEHTIAAGLVVVNVSEIFWSPLRDEDDITEHDNIDRLGHETVELYRNLPLRDRPSGEAGLEAASVIVVKHDNLVSHPNPPAHLHPAPSHLVERPPAPQPGDPLSYNTFIHRICNLYRQRWA